MGVGWLTSYSDFLSFQADGSIVWTNDQGNRFTFAPTDPVDIRRPDTLHGTFTAVAGGFIYRDKDGLTDAFNAAGHLTQIRDRNGNALVVGYDALGQIASVSESAAPPTC